jgi:guanosine-3',5'-bis(diphosphate) 3'-pyrophosphohydrolase
MNFSQDDYAKALNFAALAHVDQKSHNGLPYLTHLIKVSMEVIFALPQHPGYGHKLAVQCALLHDTLEDTAVSYKDLLKQFGSNVADGVLALTKNARLPETEQMGDSLDRILLLGPEISMVKLGDRINNLGVPPSHWDKDHITRYKLEAVTIAERLGSSSFYLETRLRGKIADYEKYIP